MGNKDIQISDQDIIKGFSESTLKVLFDVVFDNSKHFDADEFRCLLLDLASRKLVELINHKTTIWLHSFIDTDDLLCQEQFAYDFINNCFLSTEQVIEINNQLDNQEAGEYMFFSEILNNGDIILFFGGHEKGQRWHYLGSLKPQELN